MKSPPPGLCFGRIIYIDCSTWKSKRVMQRKIAHELKLGRKTMALFEEQDEEDDINGVDHGSRDLIREVSSMINQTVIQTRFMMILINGSSDEVSPSEFGIPEYHCTIIWTFNRRFVTMHGFDAILKLEEILRRTNMFLYTSKRPTTLSDSELNALFHEEAASIVSRYPFMQDIPLTMVIDCWRYGFFLHRSSQSTSGLDWEAQIPNFWKCDEIIQEGTSAREISNALDSEISYDEGDASLLDRVFAMMMRHLETLNLVVEGEDDDEVVDKYGERPYRWISITTKNKIVRANMQTILVEASSIFIAFDRAINNAPRLLSGQPSVDVVFPTWRANCRGLVPAVHHRMYHVMLSVVGEIDRSSMVRVQRDERQEHTIYTEDIYPPQLPDALFERSNKVGVLILSGCAFNFVSPPFIHCHTLRMIHLKLKKGTVSPSGHGEVLSKEKICLMANLIELNIEGVRCWQYTRQLQKRLPYLQRNNWKYLICPGIVVKNLPASLSEASRLEVLVLDGCDELENVVVPNSSLRSFSFDGYGPASHWTSTGKLPPMSSRPEPSHAVEKKRVRTCKISLEGCTLLEDLFLRGLPNLEELDLSGCATIKVFDFGAMVVDVPRLKRLFLLGCERLRAIKWGSSSIEEQLELIHIDTRPRTRAGKALRTCEQQPSLGAKQKSFKLHAVIVDARLARSLWAPIEHANYDCCFDIKFTSSTSACSDGAVQRPEAMEGKDMTLASSDQRRYDACTKAAALYGDVFMKIGDGATPMMQAFPQGPTGQLDRHIEIGDGSRNVQSEIEMDPYGGNFARLMRDHTQSLHVHDVSTYSNTLPSAILVSLVWCRVERCPSLHAVFPPGSEDFPGRLETVWASDLPMARCIWSKGVATRQFSRFRGLKHLHLRRCPSLRFALAMGSLSSFPSLETLHIIHCGSLRHVFVPGEDEENQHPSVVEFPKLTAIHLHDVPALQEICEAAVMVAASALETIRIRGCWSLRRLPALEQGTRRRPTVEVEKDVWDALEWDGVDAGHHPSLYEAPVHSRHYKRRMLRITVLR
ncbi:hypothetical protein BS78_07G011400 [Paspalum vaginatum]|nr:hypothetical protein BS78_07G011400 [Paspalum vaginatum]